MVWVIIFLLVFDLFSISMLELNGVIWWIRVLICVMVCDLLMKCCLL